MQRVGLKPPRIDEADLVQRVSLKPQRIDEADLVQPPRLDEAVSPDEIAEQVIRVQH